MVFHIDCHVTVDHLVQQRKNNRPSTKGIDISRDPATSQICLIVCSTAKTPVTFKLEEGLSKIYTNFMKEGKCTLEVRLAGGGIANVLISQAEIDKMPRLYDILMCILQKPQDSYGLGSKGEPTTSTNTMIQQSAW
eukprot:gene7308-8504_t